MARTMNLSLRVKTVSISQSALGCEGPGVAVGVKGTIAETTQTFTKMLTLGLNNML